ncbi:uncharacterized protein B0I36DRAFT_147475 [Microdochium trichocladiopsis]|uniref:Metallo-beta-lactamase domain-containing protein n=1 Tax=Microdochium trichocladiopsis TaxID=1682393 RepID=A0A9P8Y3E0_9PEZI|nr:uncharacterized protein B0I36DRAFT_147475 [Microdochium trichocladiopsis]KAH7028158.1 hypothetical protein B0I36DRAFT_147475 [Microdochium trichocladiopsis]
MSTFDGIVREFPSIRIDFFAGLRERPALACFLSHVHSDHLTGLDTLKSPFVYCSAATREILLRLERYPCRINYAQGILEAREQTYRHLAKVLKPLPLDTPSLIELDSHQRIQVTLIDANHCVGAVMFLVEDEHTAILYTGDIRAEPWWVNSIARHPCLVEYTTGLKTLDRLYLDTSMLDDVPLQTKAEGLRELLSQVSQYPPDTVFCMQAWTYGYEEVWLALSRALKSKVHVDKYKMRIYKSLVSKLDTDKYVTRTYLSKEAPALVGFTCGNHQLEGCLTLDEHVRIHSCEKGTHCDVMQNQPVVWIKPIVAHLKGGRDLVEIGVGGGGGDLNKEAELPTLTTDDMAYFIELAANELEVPKALREDFETILHKASGSLRSLAVNMDISAFTDDMQANLQDVIKAMVSKAKALHDFSEVRSRSLDEITGTNTETRPGNLEMTTSPVKSLDLPKRIRFPYARHSSLPELRHLVDTFRPKDVWPCTVDAREWRDRGITMQGLFGDCCSNAKDSFEHDQLMEDVLRDLPQDEERLIGEHDSVQGQRSQLTGSFLPAQFSPPRTPARRVELGSSSPPQLTAASPQNGSSQELGYSPARRHHRKRTLSQSDLELDDGISRRYRDQHSEHDQEASNRPSGPSANHATGNNFFFESRLGNANPIETGGHNRDGKSDKSGAAHGNNVSSPSGSQDSIMSSAVSTTDEPNLDPLDTRARAFHAAEACIFGGATWRESAAGAGLISTTDHHSTLEMELGVEGLYKPQR